LKKTGFAVFVSLLAIIATVNVALAAGIGTIRIEPTLPVGVASPAEFEVWVKPSADPTVDPHIFLVMTESSFLGLVDDVTVDWTTDGSPDLIIGEADWTMETEHGEKVPSETVNGAGYTVASLKDHLETSEPIYWAFKPIFDGEPLTTTRKSFNVTLPSSDPRMLVYVLGKNDGCELFNCRVPPTIPGFVVSAPAAIAALGISMTTLAAFAILRRKY
jgi:hypothetical protein